MRTVPKACACMTGRPELVRCFQRQDCQPLEALQYLTEPGAQGVLEKQSDGAPMATCNPRGTAR
jgi:hypothetical protein